MRALFAPLTLYLPILAHFPAIFCACAFGYLMALRKWGSAAAWGVALAATAFLLF